MIYKVLLPNSEVEAHGRDPKQWLMYEINGDLFVEAYWTGIMSRFQREFLEYGVYGYSE